MAETFHTNDSVSEKKQLNFREKTQSLIIRHMQGTHASAWLFGISFAEASFFPIPPDFFLLPVVFRSHHKWLWYSLVVIVGSIAGSLLGYAIGAWVFHQFGESLVSAYNLKDDLDIVVAAFQNHAFLTVFTAAFTPLPFKLFTIAAGIAKINISVFIIAALAGRGMRFLIVGYMASLFGEKLGEKAFKHFNILTALFAVLVLIYTLIQFL
ncbi:MAG: YqaA family protein [bacterium]|nr:YqaA family protein [bacterium]